MTKYYVGVDLGTSRTSVVTSTGVRMTSETVVGYPKDFVVAKQLGKDVLIGTDAIENRLSMDLIYPLGDGVVKDEEESKKAVTLIVHDLLRRSMPELQPTDEIYACVGVPSQASISSKHLILNSLQRLFSKILICSEPFTIAYSLKAFNNSLIVDCGAGTIDLCRVTGGFPTEEDQITLNTAGNYLDSIIEDKLRESYPEVQLTKKIVKSIKEKHGFLSGNDKVEVALTVRGKPKKYDITQILQECCLTFTSYISTAISQLIESFDPDFQESIRNNIICGGGGSRLKGIDKAIELSLEEYGGGSVSVVQDSEFCGADGALNMAKEIPEELWEKLDG